MDDLNEDKFYLTSWHLCRFRIKIVNNYRGFGKSEGDEITFVGRLSEWGQIESS